MTMVIYHNGVIYSDTKMTTYGEANRALVEQVLATGDENNVTYQYISGGLATPFFSLDTLILKVDKGKFMDIRDQGIFHPEVGRIKYLAFAGLINVAMFVGWEVYYGFGLKNLDRIIPVVREKMQSIYNGGNPLEAKLHWEIMAVGEDGVAVYTHDSNDGEYIGLRVLKDLRGTAFIGSGAFYRYTDERMSEMNPSQIRHVYESAGDSYYVSPTFSGDRLTALDQVREAYKKASKIDDFTGSKFVLEVVK